MSYEKQENVQQAPTAHMPGHHMPPEKPMSPRKVVMAVIAGAALVVFALFIGILPRIKAKAALKSETEQSAAPTVKLTTPQRGTPATEVVLPGNIEAFTDSPIYARTSGYLKKWYVDIGAHVKAGQLLAEIETPEVDQQLLQSRADLNTAEANQQLAQTTAARFTDLLKTDSVSKQETDNAVSDAVAKNAI